MKPGVKVQKMSCPDFIRSEFGIEMTMPPKVPIWKRFAELMDVDLLKDIIYLNILFGLSIFYVAEMNFKMVTPFFLANLGYSKSDTVISLFWYRSLKKISIINFILGFLSVCIGIN
jgi:hypothetical protein